MKKTIKIPWSEFVGYAMETVREKYEVIPEDAQPTFMLSRTTEPDYENYSNPDYVEIEIL